MPIDVVVVEVGDGAGLGAALDGIEEACRSGQRFAVLVDARGAAEDAHEHPPAQRRGLTRRLRGLRADLAARCVGLAFLTTPDALGARRRGLRAARVMLGCPVEAFGSPEGARVWLADRGAAVPGDTDRR